MHVFFYFFFPPLEHFLVLAALHFLHIGICSVLDT
jgi:hypothetical protein